MATKSEIDAYLKENRYTKEKMDSFWEEACKIDRTYQLLKESGKTWKDLPISAIEELPEHFNKLMVEKIDKGEPLTNDETEKFYFDNKHVSEEYGENERWTRPVTTIVEVFGRYFRICWDEGLTEMQSNRYYEQPVEVTKHTYEKTIVVTVTEWNEVEKKVMLYEKRTEF